jgi:Cd2+/Zn2+-exporting ATPase
VTQIAFDKTGTLTHGRPELVSIDVVVDEDKQSVLALAAALESGTTHPIGRGIIHAASGLELPDVLDIEVKQGQGIVGRVGTTPVQVGRSSLFSTIPVELAEVYEQGSETGRTVVMVGRDGTAVGALSLVDTVRPVSRSVIGQIRDLGLKPLLLSGDSATVASRIGTEVSIDDVRAELLPADKSWLVMEMDRESPMAMVGDGINDAPALAAARVGIAMGAGGSAAAIEAADVALMSDDLTRLPESVLLARSTRTIIQQNITFALVAKLAFLILTVGGYTSLWLAVLADVGASVLVTLNALRLMHDSSDTQR